jgi:hypothetical protein
LVRATSLVEQVEAELVVLGAFVGEKAVERVVEHQRDRQRSGMLPELVPGDRVIHLVYDVCTG